MIAYLFWHVRSQQVAATDYEARLAAFHEQLRGAAPEGLGPTFTAGLDTVPWLGGGPGYEDWYVVEDFTALGTLNAAAVTGPPKAPHDAAAAAAQAGIGGVMAHVVGPLLPAPVAWAAWVSKPAGVGYDDFHAQLDDALDGAANAWRRQMVLGPSSEYCVLADAERELPWKPDRAWPLRTVVAP